MRNMFPGYRKPDEDEFNLLWSEGLFVFDTNVLLNFYNYPVELRNLYSLVIQKLGGRIWIPFHVSLEFHRNRFLRVKNSRKLTDELLAQIESRSNEILRDVEKVEFERRGLKLNDVSQRISLLQDAHSRLNEMVQGVRDSLPEVSLDDPIYNEICDLFSERVGEAPKDQTDLDSLLEDAERRYEMRVPPGFLDASKGDEEFRDRGVCYKKKFGDLIIWRQILDHVRVNSLRNLVFITGDRKEDWWWVESGKTLGPLPELIQEAASAGAALFWMYPADQFLKYAEEYLKVSNVTDAAVEQVREVSALDRLESNPYMDILRSSFLSDAELPSRMFDPIHISDSERAARDSSLISWAKLSRVSTSGIEAVERWLQIAYPAALVARTEGFPDLLLIDSDEKHGVEVFRFISPDFQRILFTLKKALRRGFAEIKERDLASFFVVCVVDSELGSFVGGAKFSEFEGRVVRYLKMYCAKMFVIGSIVDGVFEVRHVFHN